MASFDEIKRAYPKIQGMDPDLDCDIDYQLAQPCYNETQNSREISEQMIANALEHRQDLWDKVDEIFGKG